MAISCSQHIQNNLWKVLLNSGWSIFRKGHYEQCISLEDFTYSLVLFEPTSLGLNQYVGLCLPKSCSSSDISAIVTSVLQELHQPLKVKSVDSHISDFSYEASWMAYLVVALILIVIAMVIWAAFTQQAPKIVKAFDFMRNLKHFHIREKDDLNILDGLKAFCMIWIVFNHTYTFNFNLGQINTLTSHSRISNPIFQLSKEGNIIVDQFFMMSGFLMAYISLKKEQNNLFSYPIAIIQRILRLWPAFFFAITFFGFVFVHIGSGPIWKLRSSSISLCSHFWESILFYGNLKDPSDLCMGWSWYLQADIQIFIVCVVILYIYDANRMIAYLSIIFMTIGSVMYLFLTSQQNGYQIYSDQTNFLNLTMFTYGPYMKPWGRFPGYFIGLMLGQKYYEFKKNKDESNPEGNILQAIKNRFVNSKALRTLCEVVGLSIISFVLLLPVIAEKYKTFPQQINSAFIALSRPTLILGTVILILPTVLGFGQTSFINFLLTSRLFHFIASVSFCTYLVHIIVILHFSYTRFDDPYITTADWFIQFCGILVISVFFGFFLTMFVEVPFGNLQKMMYDSFIRWRKEEFQSVSLIQNNNAEEIKEGQTVQ